MHPAIALGLSYLSGSLPSAFLAGRWRGVDLRARGSGNLGATNVLRVLGPRVGAAVFAVDVAKGAAPVFLLPPLTGAGGDSLSIMQIACAAAAIAGHARPLFLGFQRGGKGVATACGVFLALAPLQAAIALLTFAVVVLVSGFVSVGSLSGAAALPVVLAVSFGVASPFFPVGVLTAAFVTWMHRENIRRLRSGTEFRFNRLGHWRVTSAAILGIVLIAAAAVWLSRRGP